MDDDTMTRLLEPFCTTEPTGGGGAGLGLAVVHGMAHAHDGAVSISSTAGAGAGAGTQFDVSAQAATAGPLSGGQTEGRGRHVAYVDDYEAMTFLVSEVLKDLGYRVSCFEHADDGLTAVRAHPADFDIVVTDFNMPGHSGLDLARELHALRPDLPVIITTGFITDTLLNDAQACGVRLVFDKKNLVAELPGHIVRVLDGPAA